MGNLLEQYQEFCWSLFKPEIKLGDRDDALCYLAGKMANEATELLEVLYFKPEDQSSFVDEMGDVAWYLFNLHMLLRVNWNGQINTYTIYKDTAVFYLCTTTGRFLGEVLKKKYHGKMVSDETINALLDTCKEAFLCCLKDHSLSLENVLQANMEKLKERHGKNYNGAFYSRTT